MVDIGNLGALYKGLGYLMAGKNNLDAILGG